MFFYNPLCNYYDTTARIAQEHERYIWDLQTKLELISITREAPATC